MVRVCAKGSGRVSLARADRHQARGKDLADLADARPPRAQGRDEGEKDFAALLDAVHQQLRGPLVLGWDNAVSHIDAVMRALIVTWSGLSVFRLLPYARELNPTEGVWAHLKRGLGTLAVCSTGQLAALVRTRVKKMQYCPGLLDGFVAETGLVYAAEPP